MRVAKHQAEPWHAGGLKRRSPDWGWPKDTIIDGWSVHNRTQSTFISVPLGLLWFFTKTKTVTHHATHKSTNIAHPAR